MSAPRVTTFRDGEAWVARVAVGGGRIEATHTNESNALTMLANRLVEAVAAVYARRNEVDRTTTTTTETP